MKEHFRKDQIFTIPNILSLIRLAMIPMILWLYLGKKDHVAAVILVAVSAATDVVDGWVARKFDMVSDLGKVLDPLADKLTQGALIICLIAEYGWPMVVLICVFGFKELAMLVMGAVVLKKTDAMNSARWYGKACTVIICATVMFLIIAPEVIEVPPALSTTLIGICVAAVLGSLTLYACFYGNLLKEHHESKTQM